MLRPRPHPLFPHVESPSFLPLPLRLHLALPFSRSSFFIFRFICFVALYSVTTTSSVKFYIRARNARSARIGRLVFLPSCSRQFYMISAPGANQRARVRVDKYARGNARESHLCAPMIIPIDSPFPHNRPRILVISVLFLVSRFCARWQNCRLSAKFPVPVGFSILDFLEKIPSNTSISIIARVSALCVIFLRDALSVELLIASNFTPDFDCRNAWKLTRIKNESRIL